MHCWGGQFVFKKSISDLLLQGTADKNDIQRVSSPSAKAPHELHLLLTINPEHHICDRTNVSNNPPLPPSSEALVGQQQRENFKKSKKTRKAEGKHREREGETFTKS